MDKSVIYKVLQIMVLHDETELTDDGKLQVLRELFAQEDLARFSEEQAAKANETVTGG